MYLLVYCKKAKLLEESVQRREGRKRQERGRMGQLPRLLGDNGQKVLLVVETKPHSLAAGLQVRLGEGNGYLVP